MSSQAPLYSLLSLLFFGTTCLYCIFALYDTSCEKKIATWIFLPFALSVFNNYLGAIVEAYLFAVGTPYKTESVPTVMNFRAAVIPQVSASKFVFVMSICLGKDNTALMNGVILLAILFGAFAGPMDFHGLPYVKPATMLMLLVRLLTILIVGPSYGGFVAKILFFLADAIPVFTVTKVDHKTAIGSTIFHIVNAISFYLLHIGIEMGHKESPCWTQVLETEMNFPIPFAIGAIVVGVIVGNKLSSSYKAPDGKKES
jgi:hypothetical protein